MKVVKNDSNQTLTQAEMEACRQFKRSQRAGQALFRPLMDTSQPAPSWVAFLEGTGRFAVTILEGRHRVQGGRWWRHDENGVQTPIDNPLEQAWQAARAVRTQINRELELNTYVLSVVWFPDMEEDEDILDEAYGRSVHLCFGEVDLAQRLVQLPSEDQLQTHLSRRYIQREVAALSRSAAAEKATALEQATAPETAALEISDGRLVVQHADVVNVYVSAGGGDGS